MFACEGNQINQTMFVHTAGRGGTMPISRNVHGEDQCLQPIIQPSGSCADTGSRYRRVLRYGQVEGFQRALAVGRQKAYGRRYAGRRPRRPLQVIEVLPAGLGRGAGRPVAAVLGACCARWPPGERAGGAA